MIFLLKSILCFSQNTFEIEGRLFGIKGDASVELVAFNYEELTIARGKVHNGMFFLNLKKDFNEGVYKVLINSVNGDSNLNQVYQFYLIIDKLETKISFTFNPDKSIYPDILTSNVNKNWYAFLNHENFIISVINEVKNTIQSKNNTSFHPLKNVQDILDDEIKELKEIRLNYLKSNYNNWSTIMVKNTLHQLYQNDFSKESYWDQFDTRNPDLINTPLCQEMIRNYIILYYNKAGEAGYKQGFEDVIRVFSKNPVMNEWVVKYVITGMRNLNNNNLISYFTNKYNYKI